MKFEKDPKNDRFDISYPEDRWSVFHWASSVRKGKYFYSLYEATPDELAEYCVALSNLIKEGGVDWAYARVKNEVGIRTRNSEIWADWICLDVGNPYTDAPKIEEWICLKGKRTAGGNHQWYDYCREDSMRSPTELAAFLERNPATLGATVEVVNNKVVINVREPYSLGPWIGKKGRWAKAYRRLGVDVEFIYLRMAEYYYEAGELQEYFNLLLDKDDKAERIDPHHPVFVSPDSPWIKEKERLQKVPLNNSEGYWGREKGDEDLIRNFIESSPYLAMILPNETPEKVREFLKETSIRRQAAEEAIRVEEVRRIEEERAISQKAVMAEREEIRKKLTESGLFSTKETVEKIGSYDDLRHLERKLEAALSSFIENEKARESNLASVIDAQEKIAPYGRIEGRDWFFGKTSLETSFAIDVYEPCANRKGFEQWDSFEWRQISTFNKRIAEILSDKASLDAGRIIS